MLRKTAVFLDRLMRRYTPDPFVICLMLTFVVFILGISLTESSSTQMVEYWGQGFWKLISFTLQMVMILIGGYVVGTAPIVRKGLGWVAKRADSNHKAILLATLVSLIASYINWGFGLVVGALFCREIVKNVQKINYRLLVASAYSGFIVWHAGLSGSIPLVLSTEGGFSEKWIGRTIPVSETIFSTNSLIMVAVIFILLPLMNSLISYREQDETTRKVLESIKSEKKQSKEPKPRTPAEILESSSLLSWAIGLFGFAYAVLEAKAGSFKLDLNRINFVFIFVGLFLHGSPRAFIDAAFEAARKSGPILIQFPFFAGMMGMMTASGLVKIFSEAFVSISSPETFELLTFYSAGLVNLFVPSGGGQWAVQAPTVIAAAQNMGVEIPRAAMAVAWGDAWTNLLQPFWALPLLAIAELKLKDIMGFCLTVLIVTGLALSLMFVVL